MRKPAVWAPVYCIGIEGQVLQYQASTSPNGYYLTVKNERGQLQRHGAFRARDIYGDTPEDAVCKYLSRHEHMLAHYRSKVEEEQRMVTLGTQLLKSLQKTRTA